jgi:hypothetical protein
MKDYPRKDGRLPVVAPRLSNRLEIEQRFLDTGLIDADGPEAKIGIAVSSKLQMQYCDNQMRSLTLAIS